MLTPPGSNPPVPAPGDTVVLATTRTGFEAETIVAALRARGLDARTTGTASTQLWGGQVAPSRVLVPARLESEARAALRDIESEAQAIDWNNVDVGQPPAEIRVALAGGGGSKRWAWTLVILLIPAGLWVMSLGVKRLDFMLQGLAGAVLLTAAVIAGHLLISGRRDDDWTEEDRPQGRRGPRGNSE